MDSSAKTVDQLLADIRDGDPTATPKLITLLYEDLYRLAKHYLRHAHSDELLDPTALVHEAYIRLVENPSKVWDSRAHFLGAAAQSMRRLLV